MSKEKTKGRGIATFFIFFWIVLALAIITLAYLHFSGRFSIVDYLKNEKNEESVELASGSDSAPVPIKKESILEINPNGEICALIRDYYSALVNCDQETLMEIFTDPSEFEDMTLVKQKAKLITNYENITCYQTAGLDENSYIVYVVCNLCIDNVTSKPLDISCYYIIDGEFGYKINNGIFTDEVIAHMNEVNENEDVQQLYRDVKDNIEECMANDESFSEFYNEIKK